MSVARYIVSLSNTFSKLYEIPINPNPKIPLEEFAEKLYEKDNLELAGKYDVIPATGAEQTLQHWQYIDVFVVFDKKGRPKYYMMPLNLGWLIFDKYLRVIRNDSADSNTVNTIRKMIISLARVNNWLVFA